MVSEPFIVPTKHFYRKAIQVVFDMAKGTLMAKKAAPRNSRRFIFLFNVLLLFTFGFAGFIRNDIDAAWRHFDGKRIRDHAVYDP